MLDFSFLRRLKNYIRNILKFPTYFYTLTEHIDVLAEKASEISRILEEVQRTRHIVEEHASQIEERLLAVSDASWKTFENMQTLKNTSTEQSDVLQKMQDHLCDTRNFTDHLNRIPEIADSLHNTRLNTDALCRMMSSDEVTHANFEQIIRDHPEYIQNPLLAYEHDYSIGNPNATPLDRTIIFMHLRKAAGSTLTHIIRRNVQSIGFRKDFVKQPNVHIPLLLNAFRQLTPEEKMQEHAKWNQYDVLANHSIYGVHELLSRPYVYITMLRDPIDRFVSYYRFKRSLDVPSWNTKMQNLHSAAQQMSLADFARDPYVREIFAKECSYVNLLAGVEQSFIDSQNIALAKEHLQQFEAVLLTEEFDQSMQILEKLYGWKDEILEDGVPVARDQRVVGSVTGSIDAREQISSEELAILEEYLQPEQEIYAFGQQLFEKQCDALGLKERDILRMP